MCYIWSTGLQRVGHDLENEQQGTCFSAILSNHPTLAFSHRVQKSVLYLCFALSLKDQTQTLGITCETFSEEKEMAPHSSILAWRIPENPRSPMGCCLWSHTELDTTEATQQQQQHIYMEFRKMVTMTIYASHKRETDIKNRLLDSVGKGKGGMI